MIITLASFKGGVTKTTSAIHIACFLSQLGSTLLVDGDPNHSATGWAKRGALPFKVVDLLQALRLLCTAVILTMWLLTQQLGQATKI
ncbi:MAG: ParA family protein [Nostoc sp.]